MAGKNRPAAGEIALSDLARPRSSCWAGAGVYGSPTADGDPWVLKARASPCASRAQPHAIHPSPREPARFLSIGRRAPAQLNRPSGAGATQLFFDVLTEKALMRRTTRALEHFGQRAFFLS